MERRLNEMGTKLEKLENETAAQELRYAELQVQLEKKEMELMEKQTEIRIKDEELGKHTKLQQLIHKLSSGD